MRPVRLCIVLIALLGVGCSPGSVELSEGVIVRIGDRELAYSDFESFLAQGAGDWATGLDNEVLAALFSRYLEEELLLQLAVDRGLVHSAATKRRAVESLLDAEGDVDIGPEEVAAYYSSNRAEFELPERVRLRQLLLDERGEADRIAAQLQGGMDFLEVARGLGDPNVMAELEQGELARADLPPEFVEAVFALDSGETSDVLEADYGFHIFQVVERLDETTVPLARVETEIRRRLQTQRSDEVLEGLLEEARDRYNVEIAAASLPFDYSPEE
ncbi:MAG: peptidylprolyl isomerase [Acidobacteriota bacterium]